MSKTINAQNLNNIANYLDGNGDVFLLKNSYFKDEIGIYNFIFPESWTQDKILEENLKENGINSLLDLANNFFGKANVGPKTMKDIESDRDYWYTQIQITLDAKGRFKQIYKHQIHNFYYIILVGEKIDFCLLYSEVFHDINKAINEAQVFDYQNPTPENQYLVEALEVAIEAICNEFKIETELNKGIFIKKEKPNHKKDFAELLQLLTRNSIKPKDCKDVIDELILIQTDPESFIENMEMDDEYEEYFDSENKSEMNQWVLFTFLEENDLLGNSDWKFDPEDLEMFMNDLSGEEIEFEVPEETYSAALFPYAKSELDKLDLELINLNSNGDNYGFVIVNKKDVDRIMHLSHEYEIPLEKLY